MSGKSPVMVSLQQSWLTRLGSENFARLVDYTAGYRPGARRFDMGEFPQFVLVPMATAARRQPISWGVERIQCEPHVRDAYIERLCVVSASTPVVAVARTMAENHIGSAIVTKNDNVVGIFTVTDACRANVSRKDTTPAWAPAAAPRG